MAKTNRDDFSKETKRKLAARAGYVCSFPGCKQPTSGPSDEGDDAVANVGEACHISAAASGPGARRYDASMTRVERSSIHNGIWMCRTHGKLIDTDEATYTVDELLLWKKDAEARAKKGLQSGSREALLASRLYGAPRMPSSHFLGREEKMDELQKLLQRSTAVRIAASVEGLPGIGKTELALQFVYRLALDGVFPAGIFWFDAEDPDLDTTWGSSIADALGVPQGPLGERAAVARRKVSSSSQPALVVLDNVDSWSKARRPRPLPEGTHLRYVVTTRKRNLGGARFSHLRVGFLDDPSARSLLEAIYGQKLSTAPGFDDLVEYLGGHALAVELAGAFLGTFHSATPASYLAELQAEGTVEEEVSEQVRYEQTVRQAFQTLWNRLAEEARATWRLAACFEPEPVTAELSQAVGLTGRSFRQLELLHLVEVAAEGGWWMHRLTREFGQRVGSEAELAAARLAFVEGCAEFAQRIEFADGFRPYLPNRAHLDAAVALAPEVLGPQDARAAVFQTRIGFGLRSAGDLRRARRLYELALARGLKILGEDDPNVAASRSNLAGVFKDLGDLQGAKGLLQLALASDLENLGEEHPSVARSRSNLALVLKDLGDLQGAKALLKLALASDLKNLGEDHPSAAISRSNLATVLKDLGDLQGAKALLKLALASDLKNLGEDHPSAAISRSNLATVLKDLGDLKGARAMAEEAVRVAALQPEGSYVRSGTERTVRGILGA